MSEAESASPVREGDIIAGKFRVERVLGVGGMGVVVAAMHLDLEQRVALKFLLPEAASQPDVAARFAREAKAAAKIQCEHVARVIDVGTLPDGAPYMVMEYMDGEDLERVLTDSGPLPVDLATSYVLQASEAIAEAHAVGIVHRDLKPANLFLARRPNGDPIVKVLDFGISKSTLTKNQAQLTKASALIGSPLYMSPEQLTSARTVDPRSDIWALGIVLYELLAQRTPFVADSMPELIALVLQGKQEPIRAIRPDVPPALEAAIDRCLEKTPDRRFANIAELAAAIAPFGHARSDVSLGRISHVLGLGPGASGSQRALSRPDIVLTQSAPTMASEGASDTAAMTNPQWSGSVPGASARRPRMGLLIGLPALVAVLIAAGAGVLLVGPHTSPAPVVASVAPSTPPPVAAAPAPPVPAGSTPDTSGSSAKPPSTAVAVVPTASAAPVTPAPRPNRAATVPKVATTHALVTPTCRMVSYFDDDGNKRFKRDCK